ncbi:MAG: dTMP kinase [Candidatus Rifleibacteriota bacterium]
MQRNSSPGKKSTGFFITFEGPEGSGKTTQIKQVEKFFKERGLEVITTREPGGTAAGDKIRNLLLQKGNEDLEPETELFLMLAQRTEHLKKVIKPSIQSGKTVLCDRYFDSSMAYQGYGRGLPPQLIRDTHSYFLGDFLPDLTVLLLIPPDKGLERARHGGKKQLDRMESQDLSFHRKVFDGYVNLAASEPNRFIAIEVDGDPETIFAKIKTELVNRLDLE